MPAPRPRILVRLSVFVLAFLATAAEPEQRPTAVEIAQWVRQLGDDRFDVRANASKQLGAAGEAAEPALRQALGSPDAEVARRARDILAGFQWGIYPDTPAEVVALIRTYQSQEGNKRAEVVPQLLQAGYPGLRAVLKIAAAEADSEQRARLANLVAARMPFALARALQDNRLERLDALVELGHESEIIHATQAAAYWLARGRLGERITHFRSILEKNPDKKRTAHILAYLHRANGDLAAARVAAEKTGNASLVANILFEQADWKTLAARPELTLGQSSAEKLAFRAAFARLADRPKDFEAILSRLQKEFEAASTHGDDRFGVVKALLLNDRTAAGLCLLEKMPSRRGILPDLLCCQLGFREVLARFPHPSTRTLVLLGEQERAKAQLAQRAQQIKDGVDSRLVMQLVQEEYEAGLKEEAFAHCARALSVALHHTVGSVELTHDGLVVSGVFPERRVTADVWWSLLRQKHKDEPTGAVLRRLRNLLEGKGSADEVKALIEQAEQHSPPGSESDRLARRRQALAEGAVLVGLDALACSLLEKIDTSASLLRLGDLLAGKKKWARAAECYLQSWHKGLTSRKSLRYSRGLDPLPLFLAGDALVQAGQQRKGNRLIEQAHGLQLDDGFARHFFLNDLARRGFKDAERREAEILSCVSEPGSHASGVAQRRLALAALRRKDYFRAAEGFEQGMLNTLHAGSFYMESSAYVTVPAGVHRVRASGLIAVGRLVEAHKEIDLALEAAPGNVEVATTLVPQLERAGHREEAAALFDRCLGAYEKVCRDFPRCALAHDAAALIAVGCRRQLAVALDHARKAVELQPDNADYLATLAEAYFQRGDREQAIALQRRALEMCPKGPHFLEQLGRLKAGDPLSKRPSEEGE